MSSIGTASRRSAGIRARRSLTGRNTEVPAPTIEPYAIRKSTLYQALAGFLALGSVVAAAEIKQAEIHYTGNRYVVAVDSHVATAPLRVSALLTDFDHFDRLHHTIVVSKLLERTTDGDHRVLIVARPCVLIFCKNISQVAAFRSISKTDLQATMEPSANDFRFGELEWHLQPSGDGGTRVQFDAELEPAFWVPPVIGPWMLKYTLRSLATGVVENLEELAEGASS